jgi:hypothetical protein
MAGRQYQAVGRAYSLVVSTTLFSLADEDFSSLQRLEVVCSVCQANFKVVPEQPISNPF